MSLKLGFFILAMASSTMALQASQLCGDNEDCARHCEQGRYHVVTNNGTSYFGCKF